MRRFELLSTAPHELAGLGIVWPDGSVTTWTKEHGAHSSRHDHGFEHRKRYIDPAQGEQGEPTGKLASEWIREWGSAKHGTEFRNSGDCAIAVCTSIIEFLDKRFGRGPGTVGT